MKQPVFEGLATAIVTPFRNGTIDIPTFEKLLDAQLAANVDAIVVCGTTGESATLSSSEQLTLIAHAMQYTAGRCKIIAGTGSNDTAHAIDLSRAASSMGVSAVLIVTPTTINARKPASSRTMKPSQTRFPAPSSATMSRAAQDWT